MNETVSIKRNQIIYVCIGIIVIASGLSSRKYPYLFPVFVSQYAGDTLWALMVFICIGIIKPSISIYNAAVIALLFSYTIEISQLYHAQWIDSIRHTVIGGLILGYGFLWSDLVCYTVGIASGVLAELLFYRADHSFF